jgi:hypothetical protein
MKNRQLVEEIKEIEGFPGYLASNLGRIYSAPRTGCKDWITLKASVNKTNGITRLNSPLRGSLTLPRSRQIKQSSGQSCLGNT